MRIFVAGASGVIGRALVPLLVAAGHDVVGMTRTAEREQDLRALGAEPFVCDVYDREALLAGVVEARPEVVVHQLTDLPDVRDDAPQPANARIRAEGTRSLVDAALAAAAPRLLAQSTAWSTGGRDELERLVTTTPGIEGTVLRYGVFYGPGTYYEGERPPEPRVSVEHAAARTVDALGWPPGVYDVLDA
jgi:nucleoside-diphosphate-sugar epimerase